MDTASTRRRTTSKWASLELTEPRKAPPASTGNWARAATLTTCVVLAPALFIWAVIAHSEGAFLYAHQTVAESASSAVTPRATLQGANKENCGKPPLPPKLPKWVPRKNKYLLAWCHLYGWSDKLYCTERALVLAALLNRTLIVPSINVCGDTTDGNTMDLMIDVAHVRHCLLRGSLGEKAPAGPQVLDASWPTKDQAEDIMARTKGQDRNLSSGVHVISLQEYLTTRKKKKLEVDLLLCQGEAEQTRWRNACPPTKCTAAGLIANPAPTPPPLPFFNTSTPMSMKNLKKLAKTTKSAKVLSLGDTFYANIREFLLSETLPAAHMFETPCQLLFHPTPEVFDLAQSFIKEHLNGVPFAALHHVVGGSNGAARAVEDSAECLAAELTKAQVTKLFVASDGPKDGLGMLQFKLEQQGMELVFFNPAKRRSWFESMLVEQLIASQAAFFTFQDNSTYSYNVLQLRSGFAKASCDDKPLCSQEVLATN